MSRLLPQTLAGRLLLVTAALVVAGTGGALLFEMQATRAEIVTAERARLRAVAATLAQGFDGQLQADEAAWLPEPDAFARWDEAPPGLRALHAQLAEAARLNDLHTPIYTLVPRPERLAALRERPDELHPGAMEFLVTSSEGPYWRHRYEYRPAMAAALFEGQATTAAPYDDAHGTWVSAYAPVRDAAGRVVALLEVDAPLDPLLEHAAARNLRLAALAAGGLILLLLLISWVTRRLTGSLQALARSAERFGGALNTPVPIHGTREVESLAQVLEDARVRLAAQRAQQARIEADLRAALHQAQEATRTRSQFIANMSHELRTPLNAIIGYSEMLAEEAEDQGYTDLVPDLRRIHVAGRQLLGQINDVLDFSRVEAGRMQLCVESFHLAEVVDEVVAAVEPQVRRNGNELVIDLPGDLDRVELDRTRLRQILVNLLGNAAKFTEGGRIRLSARAVLRDERPWLRFEVADTGIGMTEDELARVFDAFVQGDASTTRKYGGTGLGLALVRELCALMGGAVSVDSAPGVGTTFSVLLPVAGLAAPRASPAPAVAPGAQALVVDDDAACRELLGRLLVREGWGVIYAEDGEAALEQARRHCPDLIALDLVMPGRDGWSVLAELKRDPELAAIPVVLTTMVDDRGRGLALGAEEHLVKPVDRDRLRRLLARHRTPPGVATPRVLLVDDDVGARRALRRGMERAGWQVTEAGDGRGALAAVEQARPDVVVLDLALPGMDGFGLLAALRRSPAADVPVLVLTGMELDAEQQARLNGATRCVVQKGSLSLADLLQQMDEVADRRGTARSAA